MINNILAIRFGNGATGLAFSLAGATGVCGPDNGDDVEANAFLMLLVFEMGVLFWLESGAKVLVLRFLYIVA